MKFNIGRVLVRDLRHIRRHISDIITQNSLLQSEFQVESFIMMEKIKFYFDLSSPPIHNPPIYVIPQDISTVASESDARFKFHSKLHIKIFFQVLQLTQFLHFKFYKASDHFLKKYN